ncbi:hypothetical protein HZ326_17235 [Fusarium oxysporum f. sp. albedinis]|nr:hypothetical protein HZ326_17235 [Fusarium oxysporum f. sp. albedinis]
MSLYPKSSNLGIQDVGYDSRMSPTSPLICIFREILASSSYQSVHHRPRITCQAGYHGSVHHPLVGRLVCRSCC